MRKFLVKGVLFSLPLLVLFLLLQHRLYRVPNSYNTKRKLLEQRRNDIQVLVLGSSQAFYGIDPQFITAPAFNLASVSQTLYYDTRLCRQYVPGLPHLRLVIITVGYFSLFSQLDHSPEEWRELFYYWFWNISNRNISLLDPKRYFLFSLYTQKETLRMIRNHFTTDYVADMDSNGHIPLIDTSRGRVSYISDSLGKARVAYHQKYIDTTLALTQNIDDLHELLDSLQSRHIATAFVVPPVWTTYSRFCSRRYLQLTDNVLQQLARQYNCRYLNYFSDSRFTMGDFFDNDHLNAAGAVKWSRMIDTDIVVTCIARP